MTTIDSMFKRLHERDLEGICVKVSGICLEVQFVLF